MPETGRLSARIEDNNKAPPRSEFAIQVRLLASHCSNERLKSGLLAFAPSGQCCSPQRSKSKITSSDACSRRGRTSSGDPPRQISAVSTSEAGSGSRRASEPSTSHVKSATGSSYHHQVVDRLGAGLVVTGTADDGVLAVLEHETADVIAVQWHPEDLHTSSATDLALFADLVSRAEMHRTAR